MQESDKENQTLKWKSQSNRLCTKALSINYENRWNANMKESDKESDRRKSNKVNFEPSLDKSGASLVCNLKKSDKNEEKSG